MHYAIAVGIYIATYLLAFVLPLFFGGSGSVIRLVIFSIPFVLVAPRVGQRFTDGQPLLPKEVRSDGGLLYVGGTVLIWIGHLGIFGSIGAAVYFAATATEMVPIGLLTGYAIYPYLLGIVLVEWAFRQWSNQQFRQPWKSQQNSIYIIVGVIIAAQLGFNLTSDRPVDLLSYYEREALAYGRGYAREVQRAADKFYVAEQRMPCPDDKYINVDSLLGGVNRDQRKELSIDLLDCGQFVVTIHKPIDGVTDGKLLFVASPGDADAGTPLDWQCISAHHKRIERHTNGGCTYNPTLDDDSLAPVDAPATISAAIQTSASPDESGPSIPDYLERIAEPTLWENCGTEVTSYRLLKFDAGQRVASVRITRDANEGGYRSVSSPSSDKVTSIDGFVDERMWNHIEADFDGANFWNLQSDRNINRPAEPRIYLEACKNGKYHTVQREPDDVELAAIVRIVTRVGRLEFFEGN